MPAADAAADNPGANPAANASDSVSSLAQGTGTIAAYTAPSDSRKLAFGVSDLSTALVMSVNVKEGDHIKKGQLLEEMDDRIEQLAVKTAQIKAASTAELDAEKADLAVKQSVLKRKTDTFNQSGYNTSEIEEAKLDVTTDEKRVQLAQEEQAEAALTAQSEQAKIDTMRIVAPFDGTVLKINSHAGETSDPHSPDGAIQVVKNDPLYVEIGELTTKQAGMLKIGQKLGVRYPDETTTHEATVIFRAPQADARSDTQAVRLSMPNPENRDSGMHVIVELPPDVAAAGTPVPAAPIAGNTGP
jgi:RND family efflux transporter MFP subunit